MRKECDVPAANPSTMKLVVCAASVVVVSTPWVNRWSVNCVSLLEASVHVSRTLVGDKTVATKLLGVVGIAVVTVLVRALLTLLAADVPPALAAITR